MEVLVHSCVSTVRFLFLLMVLYQVSLTAPRDKTRRLTLTVASYSHNGDCEQNVDENHGGRFPLGFPAWGWFYWQFDDFLPFVCR
jgi:hypothetical protein